MYIEKPIQHFLDKLSSKSPEPGGGSAAALVGAEGAALVGMMLTRPEGLWPEARRRLELHEVAGPVAAPEPAAEVAGD